MKLGSLAGGICKICGSDTMGSNIGCGCRKFYNEATYEILYKSEDKNKMYLVRNDFIMRKFEAYYSETEKKNRFYDSILSFWKKSGFVTKKQVESLMNFFGYERDFIERQADEVQRNFIRKFQEDNDEEIVKLAKIKFGKAKHLKKLAKV